MAPLTRTTARPGSCCWKLLGQVLSIVWNGEKMPRGLMHAGHRPENTTSQCRDWKASEVSNAPEEDEDGMVPRSTSSCRGAA